MTSLEVSTPKGKVLPYYVLSKNCNEAGGDFDMLVGGEISHSGLESYTLPAGDYAVITVNLIMGFL